MTEIEKSIRYRVNVSTSVKGIKTWDCTVDGAGFDKAKILDGYFNILYHSVEFIYFLIKFV